MESSDSGEIRAVMFNNCENGKFYNNIDFKDKDTNTDYHNKNSSKTYLKEDIKEHEHICNKKQ